MKSITELKRKLKEEQDLVKGLDAELDAHYLELQHVEMSYKKRIETENKMRLKRHQRTLANGKIDKYLSELNHQQNEI